jgi:hypothetical protein
MRRLRKGKYLLSLSGVGANGKARDAGVANSFDPPRNFL